MAERGRLSRFVQRRPFASAFMASIVAALVVGEAARDRRWSAESDAMVLLSFAGQVMALLLPVAIAVRWKGAGRRARAIALAVCALWWWSEWGSVAWAARDLREYIPNMRVVKEMLREPRRAMRTPPYEAAARALAAGDSSFLAVGVSCATVPGVDSAVARPQGVRVIRGTYPDPGPLTAEHRAFRRDAYAYALYYNDAVAERLKIETFLPGGGGRGCIDLMAARGRAPFFWP
jgi:hypothetical protein